MLSGLSAIIFYAIGDKLKGHVHINSLFWIIGGFCWLLSLLFSTVSLSRPRLDLYFIDVAGATFATLLIYLLSLRISKINSVSSVLSWLGRNSLPVLCFHLIEMDCGLSRHLNITGFHSVEYILKLLLPILLTAAFLRIKKVY